MVVTCGVVVATGDMMVDVTRVMGEVLELL